MLRGRGGWGEGKGEKGQGQEDVVGSYMDRKKEVQLFYYIYQWPKKLNRKCMSVVFRVAAADGWNSMHLKKYNQTNNKDNNNSF